MDDYNYVDSIYLHHHPSSSPPDHHHFKHNNNDDIERTTTAAVGVGVGVALSSWGDYDEKKAGAGTLESLVDQATRLVSTNPLSTTITYHGDITTSNSVCHITTTTTTSSKNQHHHQFVQVPDNSGVVLTNNTIYGSEIEHRNGKEKEEEIYAVNNEVAKMDNYVVSSKSNELRMVDSHHDNPSSYASLLTYATATSTTRSVVPDNHSQMEENKKAKKHNATSSTNNRIKATILHKKVERKRRDKINQRMETLQRLVPNICYKTDKATVLDQVIEYVKKLQNQRDLLMMMSSYEMNNNMTYPMMQPMMSYAYYMYMQQQQQQLQMSLMAGAQMDMVIDDLGSMHTNSIMYPYMSTTGTIRTDAIVHPISIIPSSHNHS